ncbi:MATE family efflux transporter [Sandarakinorhabdus cyanobacteriorum]|uniref:MATE family efflux transporter n=1 Tax=Sandarakinorhabdus cyanobacteriorum TaxID=1981098 RepID=UPI0013FE29C6|nr:MATE family efflux transporter [Sandarakinorhabdus cyanobacteriorum]
MATTSPAAQRAELLRSGPVLPTLLRLTLPNLVALGSAAIVSIAETAYVGRIGVAALGGIALAFPVFMLMQMLSAGAMGGTISGAISRAMGAGNRALAQGLALAALAIAVVFGLVLAVLVRVFGRDLFALLGGSGAVLEQALAFANTAAWGIPAIWLANTLASMLRGSGNMAVPANILLCAGIGQVLIGGAFGLGVRPFPALGIAGVALGQVAAFWTAAIILFLYIRAGRSALTLRFAAGAARAEHVAALLRIGAIAMLSPLLSVGSVLMLTRMVARFGPDVLAGYGIGVRLEFLLIPIAFSVGVAAVPIVGTAIGSRDIARARRVAWTAGTLAFAGVGAIGLLAVALPGLWVDLFTKVAPVRQPAYAYLSVAGFGYGLFGMGLCLYFASQGAGRVGGVIMAQALRAGIVLGGGLLLLNHSGTADSIFLLSTGAMVAMAIGTALVVKMSTWR